MATVSNSVTITGSPGPVFDLVTTARYWPLWHPASLAVGGVTQRPYLLGETVLEKGQIAGVGFQVAWKVTEHARPTRVVFQSETPPARITYTFGQRGDAVELRRDLDYDPAVFRAAFPDPALAQQLMHRQSDEALGLLKELVESILKREAATTIGGW